MADRAVGLIVNADDLGLTRGVSSGIVRAHLEGVVTSTSVLAVGSALPHALELLGHAPDLDVGLHLAAVGEDLPLLSRSEIPTLVTAAGRFHRSWRQLLPRLAAGRVDPDDLRREFRAQFELVAGAGVRLTHVDTHQHLHLWPLVGRVVSDLAVRWSIPAVRIPRSAATTPVGFSVRRLAARLERTALAAGLAIPQASAGLDTAGTFDRAQLATVLPALRRSTTTVAELAVHPGEAFDPDRERFQWGYRWPEELEALTSPATRVLVGRCGFELTTYRRLVETA